MIPKTLILYFDKPDRVAIADLLYCYKKYSDAHCFYYSMHRGVLPSYLLSVEFDLIIFHTVFISHRWMGHEQFKSSIFPLINALKVNKATKILLPQDEWIHTDLMNDFVNDFSIDIIFSVAPESEHGKIYNKVDLKKVKIYKVLTGYLDDKTLARINNLSSKKTVRKIDIGYRAFKAPPWLGRHGYLKTKIADVFNQESTQYGLKTDISTKKEDTLLGDSWYEFLLDCKYFIGIEGGATVIDPKGEIWQKGIEFEKKNPSASFEEFERACFSDMDGNLKLIAISPRHLEACSTKTCQVLVEGDYNGILKPGRHYLELKQDFSNIDEVLKIIKSDQRRHEIVTNAYTDIVMSGNYSYRKFVEFVFEKSLENKVIAQNKPIYSIINVVNEIFDKLSNLYRKDYYNIDRINRREKFRLIKYYLKTIHLTLLIKMGFTSLIEKRKKVIY